MSLKEYVKRESKKFTEETQILVSDHAQEVLVIVLEGIKKDPHRSWKRHKPLEEETRELVEKLVPILREVAKGSKVTRGKAITTFDLVHQMTKLADMFCGIKKIKTPPEPR